MATINWKDQTTINDEKLTQAKESKLTELKTACTLAIYDGFTSTVTSVDGVPYEFGFNDKDQGNFNKRLTKINTLQNQLINGEITQEQFDSKFPVEWKTKNLGVVNLTYEEFIQVTDDSEVHLMTNQRRYWELETQWKAAQTLEEVNAIVWQ